MNAPSFGFTTVRQKLFVGALFASLVALVIAGTGLFVYDQHDYRKSRANGLAIEAAIVGHASTAALQFDDAIVAGQNLGFLRSRPSVRAAVIYNPAGKVFASYARAGVDYGEIPAQPGREGVVTEGDRMAIFHPIKVGSEAVGTVYLAEDLELGARVASYAAIALAVLVAALGVAALLANWFQRGITRPIREIASLAHTVVEKRDYTVRATRTTRDEIGTLVDAFNEMLSEIERRTAALESSKAEVQHLNEGLEKRVGERTAQLEESNLQLRAATLAKSNFLSMMSHEIRTPMNGALGMLELLSLSKLDHQQRMTLGIVRESGRSLLRIIDDILDFSKIEAGKLEVRAEVASIPRVLSSVTGIYSGNASSKGLLLASRCDPAISPAVRVDPLRLQQILNNLVSNAIKFTAKGRVELHADLAERRPDADVVRFTVTDTGMGISEEGLSRLFQPFSQVSGGAMQTAGGTGLGLSIGQRLAGLMGGSITMSSRVGHGTIATLTLPLPIANPDHLPAIEGATASEPMLQGRRKAPGVEQAVAEDTLVLVADDHPINRMLLARQVGVLGYACEVAADGREALRMWATGRYGLLMTDCNMPEMDGYDLAREIRRLERASGNARTLIIACTANALAGDADRCFDAGMDDYIVKPVDLPSLAMKLDRWLPLPLATVPPAAGVSRQEPVMDYAVLTEIAGPDAALQREILSEFARVNGEDMLIVGTAIIKRDAALLENTAHRMKGASRAVGALALGEASDRLEDAARRGDWAAAQACLGDLHTEAANLDAHFAAARRQA